MEPESRKKNGFLTFTAGIQIDFWSQLRYPQFSFQLIT